MVKKTLASLLAVTMVFGAAAMPGRIIVENLAVSASAAQFEDLEYNVLDDGTVEITKYKGADTEVVIPAEIDGKTVTSIGGYAFYNCINVKHITLPDSITFIGRSAFDSCSKLENFEIPKNVTTIGNGAFYGCELLTELTIPDGVTSIESDTFGYCKKLKNITIPDNITIIGDHAFSTCNSLTEINIPKTVISIGYNAFSECKSLTSITLPDGITSIGESTFYGCKNLKEINIPDSVTGIGDYAFDNCTALEEIKIPDSVTLICSNAFYNCNNLKSIVIPEGVTKIYTSTFEYCSNLESVTIPDSVTEFGRYVFDGCVKITIYCHAGSAAEKYAAKYNLPYKLLPDKHEHELIAVEAKEPTTTEAGNIAYWYCPTCGKYYSDKDGINEITKADTIIPAKSEANLYPQVKTAVKDHKIGFKWTAVPGAEKYGIGVFQANKWRVVNQVDGSVTSWTSPQVRSGTYRLVVLAKVNGKWVNSDIFKKSFYVTVK